MAKKAALRPPQHERKHSSQDGRKATLQDDRRTQKTKKFLAGALKELIIEKGYDAITIQDIIDRANVGRSTFYAHYESKDQLLVGNINFQEALINAPSDDDENCPMGINLHYLFTHTKEHIGLVRSLIRTRSVSIVTDYFAEVCVNKIMEHHKQVNPASKSAQILLRYRAEAAAGGIVRMLFKWLEDGAALPTAEMINCARMILHVTISKK